MGEGGDWRDTFVTPGSRLNNPQENARSLKEYIVQQGGSPFSRLRLEHDVLAMTNHGKRNVSYGGKVFTKDNLLHFLGSVFNAKTGEERERFLALLPGDLQKQTRATLKSKKIIAELRREQPGKFKREIHEYTTALDLDELFETAGESAGLCDRDFHIFNQEATRKEISRLLREEKLSPRGPEGQFALRRALLYGDNRLIGSLQHDFRDRVQALAPWVAQTPEGRVGQLSYTPLQLKWLNLALSD